MPTLHVRNVPEQLYERIQALADEKQRSLRAEVIELLDRAVMDYELWSRQNGILENTRRNRYRAPIGTPSSEDLVREDRAR